MDILEFKKMFKEVQEMCKYEYCTDEGVGVIMGTLYCSDHLKIMDIVWEKRQQGGGDDG